MRSMGFHNNELNLAIYRNSGRHLQLCLDELKRLK